MPESPKFFSIQQVENVPEIILGTADFVSHPIIVMAQDELIQYVDQQQPACLVINFKNVQRISSEFINTLIRVQEHVRVHDGQLKLSHMNDNVSTPFKLANLADRLFKIYHTTPEAIDAF